jgi:bacillithiol biosynthesis deacetylase BshB1
MLDLLCFAPHPDDAEIWCGGYLALAASQGYRTGVVDMTKGELSTRGDLKTRAQETKAATKILGLSYRGNLGFPDGGVGRTQGQLKRVVAALRRLRPRMVLIPYWEERHPDHSATSRLCTEALFFAGLDRFRAPGEPHTVPATLYYLQRFEVEPSFYVNISQVYETKLESIKAYSSQLGTKGKKTLLNDPLTAKALEARDRHFGARIGVEFAEGYISRAALGLDDPIEALCRENKIQYFK